MLTARGPPTPPAFPGPLRERHEGFRGLRPPFSPCCCPLCCSYIQNGWRASVARSLALCAATVIPSLFPFIIANEFFTYSGAAQTLGGTLGGVSRRLFALGGAGASAIVTGLVCGYPAGAACAFGLYGLGACSSDEAERCAAFSNNAGPAFVIGGIGGAMLGDMSLGIIIWCSTAAVSLASGVLLRFTAKEEPRNGLFVPEKREFSFSGMISDSALTMLKICAFIVAFSAAADAAGEAAEALALGDAAASVARGIFELTTAANYAALNLAPETAAVIIAASVGWSGFCVHMQTASFRPRGLSLRRYYIAKLLSAPRVGGGVRRRDRVAPSLNAAYAQKTSLISVYDNFREKGWKFSRKCDII